MAKRQLTDGEIENWVHGSEMGGPRWESLRWDEAFRYGAIYARQFFEGMIDRGELIVPPTLRGTTAFRRAGGNMLDFYLAAGQAEKGDGDGSFEVKAGNRVFKFKAHKAPIA